MSRLMIVPAAGAEPKLLSASLDRGVTSPKFTNDSKSVDFFVTDDRSVWLGRVPVQGGTMEKLLSGKRTFQALDRNPACSAVLAVNYRASAGRGQAYGSSITADHLVSSGIADPERLGTGGWSYGGILTDDLIASTTRFKAAVSGAGTAFAVTYYGTDQYILHDNNEIGPSWKAFDKYVKLGYPLLHADRIKTPTLFLCGQQDFNVPVAGSEQMYQARKSLGVDTQLIIDPGEFHSIRRPSFTRDRLQRYLDWYKKYLSPATATNR